MNIIFDEIEFLPTGRLNEDSSVYWYMSESKINRVSLKKFSEIWESLSFSEKVTSKFFVASEYLMSVRLSKSENSENNNLIGSIENLFSLKKIFSAKEKSFYLETENNTIEKFINYMAEIGIKINNIFPLGLALEQKKGTISVYCGENLTTIRYGNSDFCSFLNNNNDNFEELISVIRNKKKLLIIENGYNNAIINFNCKKNEIIRKNFKLNFFVPKLKLNKLHVVKNLIYSYSDFFVFFLDSLINSSIKNLLTSIRLPLLMLIVTVFISNIWLTNYKKKEDVNLNNSEKVFNGALNYMSDVFRNISTGSKLDYLIYKLEILEENYLIAVDLNFDNGDEIEDYLINKKKESFTFDAVKKLWSVRHERLKPHSQKNVSQDFILNEIKNNSSLLGLHDLSSAKDIISDPLNKVINVNFKSKNISNISAFIYDIEMKRTNWVWSQLKFNKVSNGIIDFNGKLVQSR